MLLQDGVRKSLFGGKKAALAPFYMAALPAE